MEQIKERGKITGLKVVLIPIAIFICLAFFLKLLYSIPLKDSFLWYVGIFLYFYVPGSLLLRYLDFNKDEYFSNLFHSIALGTALIPLIYICFRRISFPELIYPFGIILFFIWFVFSVRDFKKIRISIYTSFLDIISASVLIMIVFLLLHLSHFTDIIFLENGFNIRIPDLTETIFHLGLINALKDKFPPLYVYASGIDFSNYHLNMHLEIEMFNRIFSIDTLKLTFFYFPLLYFCLLVFMPFIFIRKFLGIRFLGIVIGILMFGSDLSFIPGSLGMLRQDYPWTWAEIFPTTIWSLFSLNGYLPSLFIMFLCILYLKKFYEDKKLSYIIVFALLGFSAFGFKSSMGPHIMGASFLTGIVSVAFTKERKRGLLICVISALTALAIAIEVILLRGSADIYVLSINLFNQFLSSIKRLNVPSVLWVFYPLIFSLYIIATFGIRILGFYALRDAFRGKNIDPVLVFLSIFIVSGFFLSEVIFIGFPFGVINNAAWFSVQSLMAAWLLLAYFLVKMHSRKKLLGFTIIVILLAAPTTIQFLANRFTHTYYTIDSNALEVVRYIETTPPESVVLHPPNFSEPSLASNIAGRPTVLSFLRSFVHEHIGIIKANERLIDVELFFNNHKVIDRSSILKKYKVNYVYAPISYAATLDKEPMLLQVLKNSEYVVYRVASNTSLQEYGY